MQPQRYGDDDVAAGREKARHVGKVSVQQLVRQMFQIFAREDGVKALRRGIVQKIRVDEVDVIPRFRGGVFQVLPRPGDGVPVRINAGHTQTPVAQKPRGNPLGTAHVKHAALCLCAHPVDAAASRFLAVGVTSAAHEEFKTAIHDPVPVESAG